MAAPYEFRAGEAPLDALSRIVAQQTLATADHVRDSNTPIQQRVHVTRKRFKELRALLRLYHDVLGEEQFTIENQWYRDAARELAECRDADAIVAAIDALPAKLKRELGRGTVRHLRRVSRNEQKAVYEHAQVDGRVENIAAQLPIAAARLSNLQQPRDPFSALRSRLFATIRDGKRAMKEAYESGDSAAFHEWRKRIKDHWYHVQLLAPIAAGKLAEREQALDELSHTLGDHHDLDVIRRMVAAAEATFSAEEVERIESILAKHQRRLAKRARRLAKSIYSAKSTALMEKVARRWKKMSQRAAEPQLQLVASA